MKFAVSLVIGVAVGLLITLYNLIAGVEDSNRALVVVVLFMLTASWLAACFLPDDLGD